MEALLSKPNNQPQVVLHVLLQLHGGHHFKQAPGFYYVEFQFKLGGQVQKSNKFEIIGKVKGNNDLFR